MDSTRQQILKRVHARKPLPPPERRAALRKGANLRLRDIAEVIGVSATTVWYWEKGKFEPTEAHRDAYQRTLQALADTAS